MPEPIVKPGTSAVVTPVPSKTDYVEAAIKAAMDKDPGAGTPAVKPAPAAPVKLEDLPGKPVVPPTGKKYDPDTGLPVEAPAVKPPDGPKADFAKQFEDIAKQSAQSRQERKALEEDRAQFKTDLEELTQIRKAAVSGNPMALLKHFKIPWAAVAEAAANGQLDPAMLDAPAPAKAVEGESPLAKKLDALSQELTAMKVEKATRQATDSIGQIVKENAEKYPLLDESEIGRVLNMLNQYNLNTGKMPAENWKDSVLIACEIRQNQLEKEAERFRNFLTRKNSGVKDRDSEGAGSQAKRDQPAESFTLTNSSAAAPATGDTEPEPKTPEEYRARAVRLIQQASRTDQ